jgi:hypothetical protein
MSTLFLLPLIQIVDGVQTNEDWRLSIAFFLEDGITAIPLTGLTFSLAVGNISNITSTSGNITITGPTNNILTINVLATQKSSWTPGFYSLSLTASDGNSTRDLLASSSLTIGASLPTSVTLLVAPDSTSTSVAAPISMALSSAFQALQPTALAAALSGAPAATLLPLVQALVASLPIQSGPNAPVASGEAFINSSGFLVIAP